MLFFIHEGRNNRFMCYLLSRASELITTNSLHSWLAVRSCVCVWSLIAVIYCIYSFPHLMGWIVLGVRELYLANDTKYRHSYYGRWIGTRMRSIKWCHFQWPWTNPNPVFKVMPLFDAKYLTNGYRYDHSYYRKRIENRTQTFKWHQLQWPWVTSNPDFKVTILFNVK